MYGKKKKKIKKIMLSALLIQIKRHNLFIFLWCTHQSSAPWSQEDTSVCDWSRILSESLVCIFPYIHLNSFKRADNPLRSLSPQNTSLHGFYSSSSLLAVSTLTEEVHPWGLKPDRIARVPSEAAKGKRKSFLCIGKRSEGFRRSSETESMARQEGVCVAHPEKLNTWPPSPLKDS